jgi:hypothetical protein
VKFRLTYEHEPGDVRTVILPRGYVFRLSEPPSPGLTLSSGIYEMRIPASSVIAFDFLPDEEPPDAA